MLVWMLYVILVSVLLSGAALAGERAHERAHLTGHDVPTDGEALLAVGQRQSGRVVAVAAALACVSLTLLATAAQAAPPNADAPPRNEAARRETTQHSEVAVDPAILDRYVGVYQLTESAVFKITRDGAQLYAQLSGQPAFPIYPESSTRFFYKVVAAEIEFTVDAAGSVPSLVLHQRGDHPARRLDASTAEQMAASLSARIQAGTPLPGSEAAVRSLLAQIASGTIKERELTPELAKAMREQLPQLKSLFTELGPVVAVEFVGVGNQGWDIYRIKHEKGLSQMRVMLDSAGLISGALATAGP